MTLTGGIDTKDAHFQIGSEFARKSGKILSLMGSHIFGFSHSRLAVIQLPHILLESQLWPWSQKLFPATHD